MVERTRQAYADGAVTDALWRDAYRENLEWALTHALDAARDVSGRVIITADHGECLGDCGQFYHDDANEPHDHLTTVPWIDVP